MFIWKISLEAVNYWDEKGHYTYLGICSTAKIAINQTLRLAKKEPWRKRKITNVECLGELDFCTKS